MIILSSSLAKRQKTNSTQAYYEVIPLFVRGLRGVDDYQLQNFACVPVVDEVVKRVYLGTSAEWGLVLRLEVPDLDLFLACAGENEVRVRDRAVYRVDHGVLDEHLFQAHRLNHPGPVVRSAVRSGNLLIIDLPNIKRLTEIRTNKPTRPLHLMQINNRSIA